MPTAISGGGRIRTNIPSMNSYNALLISGNKIANNQLRLSTGKRINSAADDVAGFITSRNLSARNSALKAALNSGILKRRIRYAHRSYAAYNSTAFRAACAGVPAGSGQRGNGPDSGQALSLRGRPMPRPTAAAYAGSIRIRAAVQPGQPGILRELSRRPHRRSP